MCAFAGSLLINLLSVSFRLIHQQMEPLWNLSGPNTAQITFACVFVTQLYGKDHLVLRQLLPKSGTLSPAFSALAEGQDGGGPSAMMNSGRSLEFRRLAESDAGASIQELADKSEKNGDEEHRMNPQEQQVGEQLVQDAIDAQVKQRTLQLHQYVENARERMAAVERLEATEDLNEVVYTLANWTTLLEPELRARAETARERMKGVLEDPGVSARFIHASCYLCWLLPLFMGQC